MILVRLKRNPRIVDTDVITQLHNSREWGFEIGFCTSTWWSLGTWLFESSEPGQRHHVDGRDDQYCLWWGNAGFSPQHHDMHHNKSLFTPVIWTQGHCHVQFEEGFYSPRATTDSSEHRLFTISQHLELHAVPISTVSPLDLTIPNWRPSARPYNIKLLEERRKNWADTFFISHLPLSFALLPLLALHRP